MDAEVCAALSLDLAALRAPSSTPILPPASMPSPRGSNGGGSAVDGAAAADLFFVGGKMMKGMKI